MGTDDLFKKRREERKQRRFAYRQPKANSFLIVTEGECTEPFYFQGLQKQIRDGIGGVVDVVELPRIDIYGEGYSTSKLIEKTDEIVSRANVMYQNIWVVFDKDDFGDFDKAIKEGEERGYRVAWSNPSFEYWLYLHFHFSDSALHRADWNRKLNEIFAEYHLGNGEYQKNDTNIHSLVDQYDGVNTAIKNAKRRMAEFEAEKDNPSTYNPGTTVYMLVEELKKYLDES
ncbi:MAG: RloB domain-containing protein [Lachnospiraceae bacterium]|nr:RloB domain-containing protein [Lachnospiraceae bacterium]